MEGFSIRLSLIAAGLFAIALTLAPAGLALAQDANDADATEQTAAMVPNLSGCWQGNAFNDSQGNTLITFFFGQKKNRLSKKQSTFDLGGSVSVHGPISGKVKATQFKFHGKVTGTGFDPCIIKGTGFFQSDNSLTGNYNYAGKCFENQFTGGDFSEVIFLGATCP